MTAPLTTSIRNGDCPLTPWQLRLTRRLLLGGGVIAYPTETVYGLGCDPLNIDAVTTILQLKQRDVGKGLILVGGCLSHLAPYVAPDQRTLLPLLDSHTTAPTTWLMPAHPDAPEWITGGRPSIALRIARHPVAMQLCRSLDGALVSTSANPSGRPPARTALQVRRYFRDALDYIVASHVGLSGRPSDIRDAISGTVIRGATPR